MLDVTVFLMRWLFLSNLLRNAVEVQTIPQQVYYANADAGSDQQHPYYEDASVLAVNHIVLPEGATAEDYWKEHTLRTILTYPPGMQRLYVMDAFRAELVQRLGDQLQASRETLQQAEHTQTMDDPTLPQPQPQGDETTAAATETEASDAESSSASTGPAETTTANPSTDKEEQQQQQQQRGFMHRFRSRHRQQHQPQQQEQQQEQPPPPPPLSQPELEVKVAAAEANLRQIHEFLPQLVSAVLKSPPPVDPHHSHPLQRLQQVLLHQCQQDPSWGIELCWLLEADVGRAWKTFLEHRQQYHGPGRRLIVILPADKAAVLAAIGAEKREAFDFLQEAEQVTAFGQYQQQQQNPQEPPPPPSHLSNRRCAHFGDTMYLIDRMTRISLQLRHVPLAEREAQLHQQLEEINRRIRRRMVTRGDLTLDMEDHHGPQEWPTLGDLHPKPSDLLEFSVHLPLLPQTGTWPTGEATWKEAHQNPANYEHPHMVRVLNIVSSESRLLSSRERCPYLVQMEVADTGLEGSDARLYASSGTVHANSAATTTNSISGVASQAVQENSYNVPPTFFASQSTTAPESAFQSPEQVSYQQSPLPRGGWQLDQAYYDDAADHAGYGFSDTSPESFQQEQLEQLHHQMYTNQGYYGPEPQPQQPPPQEGYYFAAERPSSTVGLDLLDKVYGHAWQKRCAEIRQASPFGQVNGWRLASFIIKAGEDIRKESLVMQIISKMRVWFDEIPEEMRPLMRPYTIMCVGGDAGLVECLSDAKSVDEVKKRTDNYVSLRDYFERAYGPPGSPPLEGNDVSFEQAQDNFLRSLVGYSLVCYVLQIKDRHNANILLDREGRIMHIDFGFVLGDTPKMGKVPIFSERAPFKLSADFWEVLGGWSVTRGGLGVRFCKMLERAFECAASHVEEIVTLVESTLWGLGYDARTAKIMANGVRARLRMRGPPGSQEQKEFIISLVIAAQTSWGTSTYDWLQRNMNGYQ